MAKAARAVPRKPLPILTRTSQEIGMQRRDAHKRLATLCIGMGTALRVER